MARKNRVTLRLSSEELSAISAFSDKAHMNQSVALRVLIASALKPGSEIYRRYVRQVPKTTNPFNNGQAAFG